MPDFSNPYKPITHGYERNFFTKILVNNVNFTENCSVLINLNAPICALTFSLESASGRVEYSFTNGAPDKNGPVHGDMDSALWQTQFLSFPNRPISKIWFRGDGYVRIEAWC